MKQNLRICFMPQPLFHQKIKSPKESQRQGKAPGGKEYADSIISGITSCRKNTAYNDCVDRIGKNIKPAEYQHENQILLCCC